MENNKPVTGNSLVIKYRKHPVSQTFGTILNLRMCSDFHTSVHSVLNCIQKCVTPDLSFRYSTTKG